MSEERIPHSETDQYGGVRRLIILGDNGELTEEQLMNSPVDVIVEFANAQKFAASFFTIESLHAIWQEDSTAGVFLGGQFFWEPQMIIVKSYQPRLIKEVVQHLIDEGDFGQAFKAI